MSAAGVNRVRKHVSRPPATSAPPCVGPVTTSSLWYSGAPRWFDDFSAFKASVHDLDARIDNVMTLALGAAPSLADQAALLEAFQQAALRESVQRAVARHTSAFLCRFIEDVDATKRLFDALRRSTATSAALPKHAAGARCGQRCT